ncbi:MAG: hypothetical protein ABR497_09115 [Kiritimatiellia bacterium]
MNDGNEKQTEICGAGCGCGASGSGGGRRRWVAGVVVLLVAGVLVARAVVKDYNAKDAAPASDGFAALPVAAPTPTPEAADEPAAADTLKEIAAFSELNTVAADSFGVFVFLPAKGETAAKAPIASMRSAAQTIEPQLRGGKIAMFALKAGSRDYDQIAKQMTVPGVIAMVKGGGMAPVTGDITESKLIQGFVMASSAGGCGAGGGCGPRGCN